MSNTKNPVIQLTSVITTAIINTVIDNETSSCTLPGLFCLVASAASFFAIAGSSGKTKNDNTKFVCAMLLGGVFSIVSVIMGKRMFSARHNSSTAHKEGDKKQHPAPAPSI